MARRRIRASALKQIAVTVPKISKTLFKKQTITVLFSMYLHAYYHLIYCSRRQHPTKAAEPLSQTCAVMPHPAVVTPAF
jgi:hypothetical protein